MLQTPYAVRWGLHRYRARREPALSHEEATVCGRGRRPQEAYADAVKALAMEPGHPKALLRKGMAAFALEEFVTAETAFEAGQAAEPATAAFGTWLRKCQVRDVCVRACVCVCVSRLTPRGARCSCPACDRVDVERTPLCDPPPRRFCTTCVVRRQRG